MNGSGRQVEASLGIHRPSVSSVGSRSPIGGWLFCLFAIELFLLGVVAWSYLFNRSVFPGSFGNLPDLWSSLIAVAAAGWGTFYLWQSRNAAVRWDIAHSRSLMAITVASGAVVIGSLAVQIAMALVSTPMYVDARLSATAPPVAAESAEAKTMVGDATQGKEWFGMSCVSCHGPTGDGVANAAPSLRSSDFLKNSNDQQIAALIRNGRAAGDPANKTGKVMPARGGNPFLDEAKIADLVAFLKDLDAEGGSRSPSASSMVGTSDFATVQSQLAGQPIPIVRKWSREDLAGLTVLVDEESVNRGMRAFVKATCNNCHMASIAGQELGPTLDQIVAKYPRDRILEHIVEPSAEINTKFQSETFILLDGRTMTGMLTGETDDEVRVITDLLKPESVETIPIDEIDERLKSKISPMPTGLVDVLTKEEIAGLVAYIDVTGNQLLALNAPQLNRWVVPAAELQPTATKWSATKPGPANSYVQACQMQTEGRYSTNVRWLFGIATSVLSLHFLWVIGAGSAIVLNDILHLGAATQLKLAQQVSLFWVIGLVWLALWFVFFIVSG